MRTGWFHCSCRRLAEPETYIKGSLTNESGLLFYDRKTDAAEMALDMCHVQADCLFQEVVSHLGSNFIHQCFAVCRIFLIQAADSAGMLVFHHHYGTDSLVITSVVFARKIGSAKGISVSYIIPYSFIVFILIICQMLILKFLCDIFVIV